MPCDPHLAQLAIARPRGPLDRGPAAEAFAVARPFGGDGLPLRRAVA